MPRFCFCGMGGKAQISAGFVFFLAALTCAAQSAPAAPAQQPAQDEHKGQVIFSRSTDETSETKTLAPPQVAPPLKYEEPPRANSEQLVPPQVAFTAYELDVHLRPAEQQIAVRALVTVRNDGKTPLTRIPLQISSSLNWERIRVGVHDATFQGSTLNSDVDHTGQLHEALIPLSAPLAPGASVQLDVNYSGTIAVSAQRMTSIGAPEETALRAEWDRIGLDFTGLRGFGNVVWYPVVSVPVMLGEGARLFDEIGEQKLRQSGARFGLRLAVEFPHGQAPTVAVVNGHSVPLTVTESNGLDESQEVNGVATTDLPATTLGFETPSLFVARRAQHTAANLTAWTTPENEVSVQFWTASASAATPFVQRWLGQQPRAPLTLLDLPDAGDAPFESGALLAAPLTEPDAKTNPYGLDRPLVHALAHAWLAAPTSSSAPARPAWLNEGVANFLGTLWVERQHGRDAALRMLEADRAALTLAEPESPGQSPGQPLATAISPVYYRTKAAYVLWMLRDLAGDPALANALSADLASDGQSANSAFKKLLEASENHPDLSWFFADWIDADKGLPDLSIDGVFPTVASAGNWLVAVNLANNGYAAAEVPVTVRSGAGSEIRFVTHRVLVPARGKVTERILIQGKPTEVQANDGTVPETQASVHVMRLDEPAASQSNSLPK